MQDLQEIKHTGVVQRVDSERVKVVIDNYSACSGCHAKGVCSMSDKEEKMIELRDPHGKFFPGERVMISMEKEKGLKAVLWAYFFPFLLFLSVLFISANYITNEAIVGLMALFSMVPYYWILYLMKGKFGRSMSMHVEKI